MSLDLSFLTRLRPHSSPQALSALGALQPLDQAQQALDAQKTGVGAQASVSAATRQDPAPLLQKFEPAKPVLQDALQLNAKLGKDLAAVRTAAQEIPSTLPNKPSTVPPKAPSATSLNVSSMTRDKNIAVTVFPPAGTSPAPGTPVAASRAVKAVQPTAAAVPLPVNPGMAPPQIPTTPKAGSTEASGEALQSVAVPKTALPQARPLENKNQAGLEIPPVTPSESASKTPGLAVQSTNPALGSHRPNPTASTLSTGVNPSTAQPPSQGSIPSGNGTLPEALGSSRTEQAQGVQAPVTPTTVNPTNPKPSASIAPVAENSRTATPTAVGNQTPTQPPAKNAPTAPPAAAPASTSNHPEPPSGIKSQPTPGSLGAPAPQPAVTASGTGTAVNPPENGPQAPPAAETVIPPPAPTIGNLVVSNLGTTPSASLNSVSILPVTVNPSIPVTASPNPRAQLPDVVSGVPTAQDTENKQTPLAAALPRIQPVESQAPALENAVAVQTVAQPAPVPPVVPVQETLLSPLQTNQRPISPPPQTSNQNPIGSQPTLVSTTEAASQTPSIPPTTQTPGQIPSALVQTAFQPRTPTGPLPSAPRVAVPPIPTVPLQVQAQPPLLAKPRPIVNSATLVTPPAPPIQGAVVQPEPVATVSPEFGLANVAPVPIQRVTPFPEPKPFPAKAMPSAPIPQNPFGNQRAVLAESTRVFQIFQKLGEKTGSESLRGVQIPQNQGDRVNTAGSITAEIPKQKNLETVAGITLNGNNEVQPETVRPQTQMPKPNEGFNVTLPVNFQVAEPGLEPFAVVSPNPLATTSTFLRVRASVQPTFQLMDIVL